jgi:uncharacterized membrane protein
MVRRNHQVVMLQVALVVVWIGWNAYGPTRFDPYPFNLLSAFLALEAVLLTSFVLIRQNAMDERSEQRNHLDLRFLYQRTPAVSSPTSFFF